MPRGGVDAVFDLYENELAEAAERARLAAAYQWLTDIERRRLVGELSWPLSPSDIDPDQSQGAIDRAYSGRHGSLAPMSRHRRTDAVARLTLAHERAAIEAAEARARAGGRASAAAALPNLDLVELTIGRFPDFGPRAGGYLRKASCSIVDRLTEIGRGNRSPVIWKHKQSSFANLAASMASMERDCRVTARQLSECCTIPIVTHDPRDARRVLVSPNLCKSRACPFCLVARRIALTDRMQAAIEHTARAGQLRGLLQVTFTQPAIPHEALGTAMRRLGASLAAMMGDRGPWRRLWQFYAPDAFVCLEATRNERRRWWHVHAHVIANSGPIPEVWIKAAWAEVSPGAKFVNLRRKVDPELVARLQAGELVAGDPAFRFLVRQTCKYPHKLEVLAGGTSRNGARYEARILDWLSTTYRLRWFRPRGFCRCRPPLAFYRGRRSSVPSGFAPTWGSPPAPPGLVGDPLLSLLHAASLPSARELYRSRQIDAGSVADPRACWRHVHDDPDDPPGVRVTDSVRDIWQKAREIPYYRDIALGLSEWARNVHRKDGTL